MLPQAIQQQVSEVEKFYNQEEAQQTDAQPTGAEVDVSTTTTETPVEQEVIQSSVNTNIDPLQPDVVVSQPTVKPEEDYEKRFKNYKASTDQKLYEYRQQLNQLTTLQQQNQHLATQVESLQKSQPKFTKEALDSFSQDELEVFDSMLESRLNSKVGELNNQVQFLQGKLKETETKLHSREQTENKNTIKTQLKGLVEDFDVIDRNPAFHAWLKGLDAYGNIRMELLKAAYQKNDLQRVVSFYNDFKQTQTPPKIDERELEQVPDTSSTKHPAATAPKFSQHWDVPAVSEFFKQRSLGKYTEEQATAIEKEIIEYKRFVRSGGRF